MPAYPTNEQNESSYNNAFRNMYKINLFCFIEKHESWVMYYLGYLCGWCTFSFLAFGGVGLIQIGIIIVSFPMCHIIAHALVINGIKICKFFSLKT